MVSRIPYIALSSNKNYLLISVDISRLNKQALRDLRDNTKSVNNIKKNSSNGGLFFYP